MLLWYVYGLLLLSGHTRFLQDDEEIFFASLCELWPFLSCHFIKKLSCCRLRPWRPLTTSTVRYYPAAPVTVNMPKSPRGHQGRRRKHVLNRHMKLTGWQFSSELVRDVWRRKERKIRRGRLKSELVSGFPAEVEPAAEIHSIQTPEHQWKKYSDPLLQ